MSLTSLWMLAASGAVSGTVRHANSGHRAHLLRWLASFGALGVFVVAVVDSSVIPLPLPGSTDFLLLLLAAHRGSTPATAAWLATCAIAGSLLGGYLTWSAGRKGGEVTLERYIPRRLLSKITGWVERHGAWSIGVAAILPPPVPLTPFLLAAGALKVPRGHFLLFYGIARCIRYGVLAWLGVTYGHRVLHTWMQELGKWSSTVLWVYGSLVALGIAFGLWKYWKGKPAGQAVSAPAKDAA